ncbi:hypothetical protein PM3016_4014 [Paenibacillus mucilaginosus 3016]|uniref:Uncharacterized protein n=2 Tax=Paenibacillus mucilaginosus TaxID=61624 RepID=H6NI27_9BACL|nr:hypothetical protein [Paenibacillus mucilaginosus]AFC30798.1 hypothetical protein PM3016_4014 [Paenibacillus mucilaginosus 3016]AFH63121.1 hypothetical protein B2K_20860 [Paenibacillus mucilaginosus K02]WFA19405.1 hypothetical protein ERY13_20220 [Paenibacillus mucilaginosus]
MIVRKWASAYFTSMFFILVLSLPYAVGTNSPYALRDYFGWASIVGVYVVPSTFLYGSLVSLAIDAFTARFKFQGPAEYLISGFLHTGFGFLFGALLSSSLFSIYGASAALLYFMIDRGIKLLGPRLRRKVIVSLLAAPLFLMALIGWSIFLTSPPEKDFTAEEAVRFATSSTGTITDLFPKEAGTVKVKAGEYEVERETAVWPSAEKGTYEVHFIERWRSGMEAGECRDIYEVTRSSMTAKGSEGTEPPYPR